jgi:hypothetical protein
MEPPLWTPSSAAVAPLLRHFLRTVHGSQLDDFTETTAITKIEVEQAIESTVADLVGVTGQIPEGLESSAAKTVAIGAAAEAVVDRDERGRELYRELRDLYETRLGRLIRAVRDARDGTLDGISSQPASGNFPPPFANDRTRW